MMLKIILTLVVMAAASAAAAGGKNAPSFVVCHFIKCRHRFVLMHARTAAVTVFRLVGLPAPLFRYN